MINVAKAIYLLTINNSQSSSLSKFGVCQIIKLNKVTKMSLSKILLVGAAKKKLKTDGVNLKVE